jgi:hypothetical protein
MPVLATPEHVHYVKRRRTASWRDVLIVRGHRAERHHLRFADHRHHVEVEAVERFPHGQSCFGKVTLDATAIGDLVLGERGKEPASRSASIACARAASQARS